MLYLDTSVIVAVLTNEEASDRASAVLERRMAEQMLLISDWSLTEVASAIALKVRIRRLDEEHRTKIMQTFDVLTANSFEVLPVEREHFRNATALIGHPAVNLRSGDALHLAIAAHRHATVLTLDRGMAEAGGILGIRVELI